MTLRYSTVQGFWKFLGLNSSIKDYLPTQVSDGTPTTGTVETVKESPVTAGTYYLSQKAVNPDTLKVYAGSTLLTLTTHYTFDSDTSAITITPAGEVAFSGEDLDVFYEFCQLSSLNYNESVRLLESAESKVLRDVGTVFAEQTDASPVYLQIVDELKTGQGSRYRSYETGYSPIVKLQTTVNGDYTAGGTEITLTDASGFPSSGTIYIGRNKVAYTSRTNNVLTIPATTPSIDDESVVRGEVIEVSTTEAGESPSFAVLTPDVSYSIDYNTGLIQIQSYSETLTADYGIPPYGVEGRVRFTYMSAWHDLDKQCTIPEEIEEVVYMISGRHTVQRAILKSLSGQRDNFNPQSFGFSKVDIEEILSAYRVLHSRRA